MPTVLYMHQIPAALRETMLRHAPDGWRVRFRERGDEAELRALAAEAEFILTGSAEIPAWLIEAAPQLRMIQHQGVGYERIDRAAAARRGIDVALTPEGTIQATAEHTVLLILALCRQLPYSDASVRRGEWLGFEQRARSRLLQALTVGIVGLGRIGRSVAERLRSFGCALVYFDPVIALTDDEERALGVRRLPSLEALLREVDLVTLHTPLTEDTHHMINAETLALLHPRAMLVNAARGGLVDTDALAAALREGRLAAAALDVFEPEPPPADCPLFDLENVILTPHVAGGPSDAYAIKMAAAFDNMARHWRGEPIRHRVPPPGEGG